MKNKIKIIFMLFLIFTFISYVLPNSSLAWGPTDKEFYEGIDISSYQGNVDFKKVKQFGIEIVYIKATEGTTYINPYLETSYQKAKQSGLKIGFYHYVTARTERQAINEAKFFIKQISGKSIDCKLVMDFETFGNLNKDEINKIGLAFLKEVEKLTGKQPILYSNTYTATTVWDGEVTNYPLWVAEYDVNSPKDNGKWNNWAGWQYTDRGEVNGINTYVDKNKFTKDVILENTTAIPPLNDSNQDENDNNDNSNDNSNSSDNQNGSNNQNNNNKPVKTKKIKIKRGDTLWSLAIKYNTTVSELVRLNNIKNPNLIYDGNILLVPDNSNNQESNGENTNNSGNVNHQNTVIHIVKRGETLSKIAQKYNTNIYTIAKHNNIRNINLIYTGQRLVINAKADDYEHDCGHIVYTVKRGDSLWKISKRYNTSIAEIVRLNRIKNPRLIYPGQRIRICL